MRAVNIQRVAFGEWIEQLEARHLADLTFQEVSRSLRALSSTYVERRGRLAEGAALSGAGKRAAFALFYGPLHFLIVDYVVRALPAAEKHVKALVDLGCGTGAAGAAWSAAASRAPDLVVGVDRNQWALTEAAWTYRQFGLRSRMRQDDAARAPLPKSPAAFLAAFTLNELPDPSRVALLQRLLDRGIAGDRVLILEPLARGIAPWWNEWARRFEAAGGRADEWRTRAELPPLVLKLDRAAGLDHRELTARSIYVELRT
ncbi:MAG TPA: class I SAM-dependent methyltransferase [Vicinamibacterales bacterium]